MKDFIGTIGKIRPSFDRPKELNKVNDFLMKKLHECSEPMKEYSETISKRLKECSEKTSLTIEEAIEFPNIKTDDNWSVDAIKELISNPIKEFHGGEIKELDLSDLSGKNMFFSTNGCFCDYFGPETELEKRISEQEHLKEINRLKAVISNDRSTRYFHYQTREALYCLRHLCKSYRHFFGKDLFPIHILKGQLTSVKTNKHHVRSLMK